MEGEWRTSQKEENGRKSPELAVRIGSNFWCEASFNVKKGWTTEKTLTLSFSHFGAILMPCVVAAWNWHFLILNLSSWHHDLTEETLFKVLRTVLRNAVFISNVSIYVLHYKNKATKTPLSLEWVFKALQYFSAKYTDDFNSRKLTKTIQLQTIDLTKWFHAHLTFVKVDVFLPKDKFVNWFSSTTREIL